VIYCRALFALAVQYAPLLLLAFGKFHQQNGKVVHLVHDMKGAFV
jgi:hypothetical protein